MSYQRDADRRQDRTHPAEIRVQGYYRQLRYLSYQVSIPAEPDDRSRYGCPYSRFRAQLTTAITSRNDLSGWQRVNESGVDRRSLEYDEWRLLEVWHELSREQRHEILCHELPERLKERLEFECEDNILLEMWHCMLLSERHTLFSRISSEHLSEKKLTCRR